MKWYTITWLAILHLTAIAVSILMFIPPYTYMDYVLVIWVWWIAARCTNEVLLHCYRKALEAEKEQNNLP